MKTVAYQPIEQYGIIGDMHSLAMVGQDGSIDWFCFPFFDSPSIFAKLLDPVVGGYFQIKPAVDEVNRKQLYLPETNVLISRFFCKHGVGEVTDFMPVHSEPVLKTRAIIRQVRAVRGEVRFKMECMPSFDYGNGSHETVFSSEGVHFTSPDCSVYLTSPYPLQARKNGAVIEFDLMQGQQCTFVLTCVHGTPERSPWVAEKEADDLFISTVTYWRKWISKNRYRGRWREMVDRSAFTLKLLTFQPTGAIIAAATTSLPEEIGGTRNWDYRYTWVRNSAFSIYALLKIGFVDEAAQFISFIENRCQELEEGNSLQSIYGIDGRHVLEERTLQNLNGYMGSKPVRIGNNRYQRQQLDIHGPLMDAIYFFNKHGSSVSDDFWRHASRLTDWVCDNWGRDDQSIWEAGDTPGQYVYSKFMSWVAIDRALRLADDRAFPADRDRWTDVRDAIFQDVMLKGWNESRGAFTQQYGSSSLDASVLLMPLTSFLTPTDPRVMQTLEAILKDPSEGGLVSNSLVYRYNPDETGDGLPGEEGTFTKCTFWLVEVLIRAGRKNPAYLEEARMIFEKMLGFANHLGIYSEQIGAHGEALGNFPLASTHVSLISAAYNLDRALD
jgi:GH15 family glucan-1,4-alpha-glucosidase